MTGQVDGHEWEPRRERRVYGFVEAITPRDEISGLARMDLVLDAVDAEKFDWESLRTGQPNTSPSSAS
jgi:hypothetical protein